ncbi:hypothetical protein [Brevundimonas sp.]|jgi:hypothetical protein|uniref:hypothetical protein n=1 Tax=Brevundimonas sp. TaxID=1871086 RepID=UPI002E15B40E|nr:hypothetical protein [Brevundimonas sp.]
MAALTPAHVAALAALIDRCPDAVLLRLMRLVPQIGGAKAVELTRMMEGEARNRRRRATAFSPFLPLFLPRVDGVEGLTFPRPVLPRLWAAAVVGSESLLPLLDEEDAETDQMADRLCRAAAGTVRDAPETIWPADLVPERRERGLMELAGCLDLAPLARTGARQLPGWLQSQGGDETALRLLLKDAAAVAPDGAARMIEILFAHLADAPEILRIVTRTSSAAAREDFLEGSELADFVARIVRAVRLRAEAAAAFDPAGGMKAVEATLADLRWSTEALTQLDICLERDAEGEWSREIKTARKGLADRIGRWIKTADKAIRAAAPRARTKLGARSSRQAADVDAVVEVAEVENAQAWAGLLAALRGPAATFGCEGDRKSCVEALGTELIDWADEAIHAVNGGDAADEEAALARIGQVADILAALDAGDAARTVRRRLAVAGAEPQTPRVA